MAEVTAAPGLTGADPNPLTQDVGPVQTGGFQLDCDFDTDHKNTDNNPRGVPLSY